MKCFVPYEESSDFPIENLPYGVFKLKHEDDHERRCCVAIGEFVLDLGLLETMGIFKNSFGHFEVFRNNELNYFMSLGREVWTVVRRTLQEFLMNGNSDIQTKMVNGELVSPLDVYSQISESSMIEILEKHPNGVRILWLKEDVVLFVPAKIGDYTDFYSSKEHATNLGKILRPEQEPLLPNWVWIPIGYHGRSSSIIISGTQIKRPSGQVKPPTSQVPSFKKCAKLDYELEIAVYVGPGNKLGEPISMEDAENHIFGISLLNDWSARDIQSWEYVPLGPFNGKNFATTVSPWIVTLEALEPFRCESPLQEPMPLDYLKDNTTRSSFDINLEIYLKTKSDISTRLSHSNFKYMYWTMKQQLVHHTCGGCNLNPGDVLGSGTISGPGDMMGSMSELCWNGTKPIELPNGEKRSFIEDGDTITLTGWCQGEGYRIGFGLCEGTII